MRRIATVILLSVLACEAAPDDALELRQGETLIVETTGQPCEPAAPPLGVATELWSCPCDPDKPECADGLQCVPLPDSKEHRCLAPMFGKTPGGGGYITNCEYGGEERAAFYPWGMGQSEPFCSVCLGCAPPLPDSLICQ